MKDYFTLDEKLQVNAFLQVPKAIFKDPYKSLTTTARIVYAFYLNRYVTTTFKDEEGIPYIIYSDEELAKKLGCARQAIGRQRQELISLNLVRVKKSVSYNKIYIYDYRSPQENKAYYDVNDINNLQFYKFPHELFEEPFKNLSLNDKMLYVYYLDIISLSQAHVFADKYHRVFFYDDSDTQGNEICLSSRTISTTRQKLIAAELLYKIKPFKTPARYYLRKLSQFNEGSLMEFNKLKKTSEKSGYIKRMLENMSDEALETFMDENIMKIHNRKNETIETEMSAKMMHDEDGTIHNRNNVTSSDENVENLLHPISQKDDIHKVKDETSSSQEANTPLSINETHIINTKKKETIKINTNIDSLELNSLTSNEWNESIKNIFNYLDSLLSLNFDKNTVMFAKASFESLSSMYSFKLKNKEKLITLNQEDMLKEINKISSEKEMKEILTHIIDVIYKNGYKFATVQNQINCFITIMFNELINKKEIEEPPSWFNAFSYQKSSSSVNVPDEIADYNWWD